jgi:hypothetical protein
MPEPASSFFVGNAPQGVSYAAPLLNFAQLSQLPQDYFQGTQRQRTLSLQQPVIDPSTGQPTTDPRAILAAANQRGGLESALQVLPLAQRQQFLDYLRSQSDSDQSPDASTPAPSSNPSAAGPANIRGPRPQQPTSVTPSAAAPAAQPTLSSVGTDNNGQDTLRSVMTETFGGRDVSPIIPRVAAVLKIDPDAPLSSDQMTAAKTLLTRIGQSGVQPGTARTNTTDTTGAGAPVTPVGGTGGNGAPTPGTRLETAAPATGIVPNGPVGDVSGAQAPSQAATSPSADAVVPASYRGRALEYAQLQRRLQQTTLDRAQQAEVLGIDAKALQDRAAAAGQRAQIVEAALAKDAEQTEAMKNARSGATSYNAASDAAVKSASTKFAGIVGSANEYENDLKPKIDLATSILNDPRIYTGTGGDWSLAVHKAESVFGSPVAAQLQETLKKVTASSILDQINGLKSMMMEAGGASSNAGRIFQQQIELMNQAAPQLTTTVAGNRTLVELERRNGEQATAIRDLALDYLGPPDANGVPTKHKFLDAGFEKVVSNYLQTHPLFNKDELGNPSLLGAPTAPPNIKSRNQAIAWTNAWGLKAGDPIRVNGQYKYFKPPTVPAAPGAPAAPAQ